MPPLNFKVSGLGLFPTTVYAEIYDTNNALEIYRESIKDAIKKFTGSRSDGQALVKGITFANLVRFKHKPASENAQLISSLRDIDFGGFSASQCELVATDKLLSRQNTIVHKSAQLPMKQNQNS